jgi:glycosyltransferase involved in cell wall biosynthesis
MISIILPVYNEEEKIEHALREVARHFSGNEIIVVSDGSDKTREIAENAELQDITLSVLEFSQRMGKWGSIRKGIEAARGDYIGFLDIDLSVSAGEANRLLNILKKGSCDIIISSRYKTGSTIMKRQPLSRIILSRGFNRITRSLYGLEFKDTQCGFKVFRSDLGKKISSRMFSKGFEGDVEFLWLAKKFKAKILEEPVTWTDADSSSLRPYHLFSMLLSLIRTRLWRYRKQGQTTL